MIAVTKMAKVKGMIVSGNKMKNADIEVRVTVDKIGKTLSLSDGKRVMLGVPMEGLEKLILPGFGAR